MKRFLTLLLLIICTNFLNAQSQNRTAATNVIVSTGAGYTNEVYYNFQNGSVKTSARNTWDIAFTTYKYDISILANNGNGIELRTYPNGDIFDWSTTLDVTGFDTWRKMYNSIDSWTLGAFCSNADPGNPMDYGWGVYNDINHHIVGDSILIIKLASGVFKKIIIVDKNAVENQWTFKYADLDGANEQTVNFDADNYSATNFIHYSIENQDFVVQEADKNSWDLLFTKYYDYTIPYYVTGVLNNSKCNVQQVNGVIQSTFNSYNSGLFSDIINTIGSDWKTFDMNTSTYVMATDVVYFIQQLPAGNIWKIYFTGFTGSSAGEYSFVQEELPISSINKLNKSNSAVYPNPSSNTINLIFDIDGKSDISIYNITGQLVYNESVNYNNHLNKHQINIENFAKGLYNVIIKNDNKISNTKFIKQ